MKRTALIKNINDKSVNPKLKITPRESQCHSIVIRRKDTKRKTNGTITTKHPLIIKDNFLAD